MKYFDSDKGLWLFQGSFRQNLKNFGYFCRMEKNQGKNQHDAAPVMNCDGASLPVRIESLIYTIRDQPVMIDRDLARLYGVEMKVLNQAVKRNVQRFPKDFMFQLTKEECLRSQFVTLKEGRGYHLKYMPYVFTDSPISTDFRLVQLLKAELPILSSELSIISDVSPEQFSKALKLIVFTEFVSEFGAASKGILSYANEGVSCGFIIYSFRKN